MTKPTEINNTFIPVVATCTVVFFTFVTSFAVVIICIVLKKKGQRIQEQDDVPVHELIPLPPNVALNEPCKSDWTSTKDQESDENYYDEVKTIRENVTQFAMTENDAYM